MSPPASDPVHDPGNRARRDTLHVLLSAAIFALAALASGLALQTLLANRLALRLHWSSWIWWRFAGLVVVSLALEARAIERLLHRPRGEIRSALFVLRVAFVVLSVALGVVLVSFQPARGLECELALGLAGGGFALAVLAEPLLRLRAPRTLRVADFIAFQICLAAWTVEAGLRAKQRWDPSPILAHGDAGPARYLEAFHLRPGQTRFGFPCNSAGHYDEESGGKRAGEFFVLNLGDSFSVSASPHALHYTTICERELGDAAVYNMGAPAIGPPEYLELLRAEGLALRPDAIVVALFIGNDLRFFDARTKQVEQGLVPWFDAGRYLTVLLTHRLLRLESARGLARSAQPIGDVIDPAAEPAGRLDSLDELLRVWPWLADVALERPSFTEQAFRDLERTRIRTVCRAGDPPYTELCEVLLEIKAAAREIPLFVLLIPDEFQVEDAVWQAALANEDPRDFERWLPQERLVPWLTEHGIEAVDLLPAMRAVEPMPDGRVHLYHLRNTHFNVRGHELTGNVLAHALRPLKERVLAREPGTAQSR